MKPAGRAICRMLMALFLLAPVMGCRSQDHSLAQPINYRLKWLANISSAGALYGKAFGRFEKAGLQVTVKPGGPELDAIKELEIGHAQFGVASADQIIRALAKGSPIVVLAQIFQQNPLQWIFRPSETPLHGAEDLRGKHIGITYGGNDETIMRALLTKYGIATDAVDFFSVRYDYTPFFQKQVQLWPVYRNAEGVFIQQKMDRAGETAGFFDPGAYGIRFVANSVITSRKMLEQHPRTVAKFVEALMESWRLAMDPQNARRTVETVHRFDPETSADTIAQQLEVTRRLIQPSSEIPIGHIDRQAWRQTAQILLDQKLIDKPVAVEACFWRREGP